MAEQIKRIRVKFLDSIAGLRDATPATLDAKYTRMRADLKSLRNGKNPLYSEMQIDGMVEEERRRDEKVIRTGFAKDWSFKPGDEAAVNVAIAEEWEAAGICSVLPVDNRKTAAVA